MVVSCTAEDLRGLDELRLVVVRPTPGGDGLRFRCPVPKCTYLGATLGHAGECLKHLKDSKHDPVGHAKFWRKTLVCFENADGKGILNTRPSLDNAPFAFLEAVAGKPQTAYTKVSAQMSLTLQHMHPAQTRQDTCLACSWGLHAACAAKIACMWWSRHAPAVLEGFVNVMWCLKPCPHKRKTLSTCHTSSATFVNTIHGALKPATHTEHSATKATSLRGCTLRTVNGSARTCKALVQE